MKTKFKIGDELFFMKYLEPVKNTVKGIAIIDGNFGELTDDNPEITVFYSFDKYSVYKEDKVFASKEELQNYLFRNL